jgi:hypothetical protein
VRIRRAGASRDLRDAEPLRATADSRNATLSRCLIRFKASLFDVAKEPENPINPIPGASLLTWLAARWPEPLVMSAPAPEDWGWYLEVAVKGRMYLLGASGSNAANDDWDWVLQIKKKCSLGERLLARGKLEADDPCVALARDLLQGEPGFRDLVLSPS